MPNQPVSKPATTIVPISALIANRFSPRVFDETHTLSHGDLLAFGEAVRWAPSSNNAQPWKFAFLTRDSEEFKLISEHGLTGFNQTWAPKASMLAVVMANKIRPDGKEWDKAIVYYNAGLASQQLVFEAESMGLKAHYMGGIIHDMVQEIVDVKDVYIVNIIAVGLQASHENVSAEMQERELQPRERKPLMEIISHGINL